MNNTVKGSVKMSLFKPFPNHLGQIVSSIGKETESYKVESIFCCLDSNYYSAKNLLLSQPTYRVVTLPADRLLWLSILSSWMLPVLSLSPSSFLLSLPPNIFGIKLLEKKCKGYTNIRGTFVFYADFLDDFRGYCVRIPNLSYAKMYRMHISPSTHCTD